MIKRARQKRRVASLMEREIGKVMKKKSVKFEHKILWENIDKGRKKIGEVYNWGKKRGK